MGTIVSSSVSKISPTSALPAWCREHERPSSPYSKIRGASLDSNEWREEISAESMRQGVRGSDQAEDERARENEDESSGRSSRPLRPEIRTQPGR